ncbi:MAG: winged helix-turn-helix transcriptional regulator [Deltaproteobacteria bacterium]|nr:winged helix-turn-helix transcriptional regulator [Deltaproteobacteria bacterium]
MPKKKTPYLVRKDAHAAKEAAETLKAMAHPMRLRIVAILAEAQTHVNALAEELGTSQSTISQQLRILRMRKLVTATRKDGHSVYRLDEPHLLQMLDCIDGWVQKDEA